MSKPTKRKLKRLYQDDLLSARQIGAQLGVSHTTVKRWLRAYDIPRRPNKPSLAHSGVAEPTREELYHLIHVEHLGHREAAQRLAISTGMVGKLLDRYDIRRPSVWETRRKGRIPKLPDRETLTYLYFEEGHSQEEIAEQYGVTGIVIARLFREYGLEARPAGFKNGIRYLCKDGHEVRSLYEQRVDGWLYTHSVPHEYEPQLPPDKRFKADFLANGWYIEIWGVQGNPRYQKRKQRKRQLYQEHNLPLIQVSKDDFSKRRNNLWQHRLIQCLNLP